MHVFYLLFQSIPHSVFLFSSLSMTLVHNLTVNNTVASCILTFCPWYVNVSLICIRTPTPRTQLSVYLQLPNFILVMVLLSSGRRRENIFLGFFGCFFGGGGEGWRLGFFFVSFFFFWNIPSICSHSSIFFFFFLIACSGSTLKWSCLSPNHNLSFLLFQAYIEKYKFTSVVAQDLLDSFLNFFPELKEQCVESKAGRKFT